MRVRTHHVKASVEASDSGGCVWKQIARNRTIELRAATMELEDLYL